MGAVPLGLAGCTVVGSEPVYSEAGQHYPFRHNTKCQTELGSYALPKAVIRIEITRNGDLYQLTDVAEERVTDNAHVYCLDHLRSVFASDTVRVLKHRKEDKDKGDSVSVTTPFLQTIASRAIDESAIIARKLIRAAFTAISGDPNFRAVGLRGDSKMEVVAVHRFDPFDQEEVSEVNQAIREFGFCMVLEDYTFDTSRIGAHGYCDAPRRRNQEYPSHKAQIATQQKFLIPRPAGGIFYRPRASYRLSVHVETFNKGKRFWRLAKLQNLNLENISPVISVGIGRAAFATRRTALIFEDGTLLNVCVSKGSEIAGFIDIPLDVIYGIIALPSRSINAAINASTTRQQLIEAQQRLIKAQNDYITYLSDPGAAAPDVRSNKKPVPLDLGGSGTDIGVPAAPLNAADSDFVVRVPGADGEALKGSFDNICDLTRVNTATLAIGANQF